MSEVVCTLHERRKYKALVQCHYPCSRKYSSDCLDRENNELLEDD